MRPMLTLTLLIMQVLQLDIKVVILYTAEWALLAHQPTEMQLPSSWVEVLIKPLQGINTLL